MRKLVDTFPKSMTERYFVVRTAIDLNLQHYAEHVVEIDAAAVRPRLRRQAKPPW